MRPGKQRRRERQRIVAVAVGVFRDEQIVADQQRLLHRAGGDVERLEQEGADDERDDQRVEDHAHGLGNAAFLCALPLTSHSSASCPFALEKPRALLAAGTAGRNERRRISARVGRITISIAERCRFVPFFSELGSRSGELRRPGCQRRRTGAAPRAGSAYWPIGRTVLPTNRGKSADSNGCRKCLAQGCGRFFHQAPHRPCHGARGTAEITTIACAIGPSSVMVTSMRASQPAGVIACEALERAAGELHGRTTRRQVDHAHVAPEHARAQAGAERLGAGLLGGEPLGVGLDPA